MTKDSTDYLWYSTQVFFSPPTTTTTIFTLFSQIESNSTTGLLSYHTGGAGGEVVYLFVNGKYETSTIKDRKFADSLEAAPVSLHFTVPVGASKLDLLSVSVGLNNYGTHMEENQVGIISTVKFNGNPLTDFTHSIGLSGESLTTSDGVIRPCENLCWYHLSFPTPLSYAPSPSGLSTIALDLGLSKLSKGMIYVNGHMIGRYFPLLSHQHSSVSDIGRLLPAISCLPRIARSARS